ncbi:MATE family efflux transporter [Candidatus Parcubacteria bacterium]|nr:MAG: MATE family efflux transporter [Candidatus Parcubacteria bacterium]
MKKYDFTQGSIFKSLLLISVPIIFANILQTAYQLIDTFWLGRLGASALASASLSFPIIYFVISLAGGLATAAAILTAQYKGGKKFEKINMATGQTLAAIMLVAIPISLFGISCSGLILRFMDVGGDIYANAVSYLRISFAGAIFMFIFMVFQSAMRGIGNVKTPMYIVLVTVILNFFLDPIFIFGFDSFSGYGVAGAAIATVITQTIAALTALYILFFGNKGIKIKMCDLKIKKLWIFKIFK